MPYAQANGIRLAYECEGPADAPVALLVMGLGMQLVSWPEAFVRGLLDRGLRVLRFDNRDAGLSEGFDHLGAPRLPPQALRYALHLPVQAVYSLDDLAADTLGLLDALGIPRVHLVGISMGGMIGQLLAARHPDRVTGFTALMTSSGARHLPPPTWPVRIALARRVPAWAPLRWRVAHYAGVLRLLAGPSYPPGPDLESRVEASLRRAWRPAGTLRQMLAVMAAGDRSALLATLRTPTLIVHGAADPLVRVAAAHDLARRIPQARLQVVPGMGHDLPAAVVPRIVGWIGEQVEAAARAG